MNLLPSTEKDILKKGLRLRALVVASFLVSAFLLIGLVMLLPSYFLASENYSKITLENYLPETEDKSSVDEIVNLPKEINSKLEFLLLSNNNISAFDSISNIIKYLPAKVKLNSISFTKNQNYKGKNGDIILISGTATDRDSLVSFSSLLEESGSFSSVEVPVSSLTRDKNLPFSMNIFIEN